MSDTQDKIQHLLKTSRQVIIDCCLENGAIVAANTDKEYYPKNAYNYRWVWPRDVSYALYAAHLLGINEPQDKFLDWLLNRAEEFSDTGVIYHRYVTNGSRETPLGTQYQPDQAGSLIWALLSTNKTLNAKTTHVITLLADGLCLNWDKENFRIPTYDLWEERATIPRLNDNFVYSLAACCHGLKMAHERLGAKASGKWLKASQEMESILKKAGDDYYPRLWGKLPDNRIDACVSALAWPFPIFGANKKLLNSLKQVGDKLLTPQGVMRYEHDEYEGTIENLHLWKKGAGAWPLNTFWYMIALARTGRKEEAKFMFTEYIKKFEDFIPEQVFDNDIQVAVSPLCWSHVMFVIAADELGFMK